MNHHNNQSPLPEVILTKNSNRKSSQQQIIPTRNRPRKKTPEQTNHPYKQIILTKNQLNKELTLAMNILRKKSS